MTYRALIFIEILAILVAGKPTKWWTRFNAWDVSTKQILGCKLGSGNV